MPTSISLFHNASAASSETLTRRSLLLATLPVAGAAAAALAQVEGTASGDPPASDITTYRLTPHIRRYYEAARF